MWFLIHIILLLGPVLESGLLPTKESRAPKEMPNIRVQDAIGQYVVVVRFPHIFYRDLLV